MGATQGYVSGPGDGLARLFGGHRMVIKVSGADTLGQLAVIEATSPVGARVHPHAHAGEDEIFYLLEGEIEVFCGADRWTVSPGSLVFLPRDVEHRYNVISSTDARLLIIVGPAHFDQDVAMGTPV